MLKHIQPAHARIPTLIETRERIERQIAMAAVSALIGAGYAVAVYDGERYVQGPSAVLADVASALLTVGEDHLHVYLPTARATIWAGWVQLRYGSAGWDTLADYSAKLSPALAGVVALAQQLRTARFIVQYHNAA